MTWGARDSGDGEILADGGLQVADSKVLRATESREHDSWRGADLPPSQQENDNKDVRSARCVVEAEMRTFIVYITSWACATLTS